MAGASVVVNGQIGLPSSRQMLAAAGAYYTVTNPTIGTPVVGATIVAWSATANGMFMVSNGNPPSGKNIIFDSLTMRLRATAPSGTLTQQWECYNETGIVTGTGNVTSRTPINVNAGASQSTGATVQAFAAGCITVPAAVGTRRLQDTATITTGVAVDGDTYILQFGADGGDTGKNGGAAARATDPASIIGTMGPIVVAPGTTSWLNMWWLTQASNIPSWEYRFAYSEL